MFFVVVALSWSSFLHVLFVLVLLLVPVDVVAEFTHA